MDSFQWNAHFVTGLAEVDKQHHLLVDIINRFGALLVREEGIPFGEMEDVFNELAAYTQYHFTEEESLMAKAAIDTRHFEHHQREHQGFLQEVTQLHAAISPDNPDTAEALLKFLTAWLAYHILGSDQSMAKQLAAIQSGQTAQNAYQTFEHMKEGAVEPLLYALNNLFQQVSERNRQLQQLNRTLEQRVAERTRELAVANHQLEEIALTDVLTGLPNRRHAMQQLEQAWEESVRLGTPLSCMMIDADGFKQINDSYGHDAGDEVLRQLAQQLSDAVRTDDIVCRLGGDEFFVICPHTLLDGGLKAAEKVRAAVAALRVPAGGGEWQGSISVGVAERKAHMASLEALMKSADNGVYLSKKNGRNRVSSAD